jgi:mannitol-1-phosphate/altronate dehydrogenase
MPLLNAVLEVLDRHDVAYAENDQWRITVELFRRWVVDRLYITR